MLNRLGSVIHWSGFILGCIVFLGLILGTMIELNDKGKLSARSEAVLEAAIEDLESYPNRSDATAMGIKLREAKVRREQLALNEIVNSNRTEGRWLIIAILFIAPLSLVVSMVPF